MSDYAIGSTNLTSKEFFEGEIPFEALEAKMNSDFLLPIRIVGFVEEAVYEIELIGLEQYGTFKLCSDFFFN